MLALYSSLFALLLRGDHKSANRQACGRQRWGWLLSLVVALAPVSSALAEISINIDSPHCPMQVEVQQIEAESNKHLHHAAMQAEQPRVVSPHAGIAQTTIEQSECCAGSQACGDCSVNNPSLMNSPIAVEFITGAAPAPAVTEPSADALPLSHYRPPTSA